MKTPNDFDSQFNLDKEYYFKHLDFLCWYRYFFIIREVIDLNSRTLLEIGPGHGIVKSCLQPIVEKYQTMDINAELKPDILADMREFKPALKQRFDCIIASDVLEHIPFSDIKMVCSNIFNYLMPGGKAIITIPHRRSNFLFMTPSYKPHVFTVPTGFLSPGAFYRRFIKRRIWIDPYHLWEIGDDHTKKKTSNQDSRKPALT